jgi:uncharacterized protein involved in outer membrane biogenesis
LIKKILFYTLAAGIFLMASGIALVYLYQDKIIQLFVEEANQHLKTEVKVGKISLSLFDKFPQLAIKFDQIRISGANAADKRPLAVAKKLYGTFDLRDLWSGRYTVSRVYLEEADVLLTVDEDGLENFDIFRRGEKSSTIPKEDAGFDIQRIILKNVHVRYERGRKKIECYEVLARDLTARLSTQGGETDIALEGDLTTQHLLIDNRAYFKNKQLAIKSELRYRQSTRELTIHPSDLTINRGAFTIQGRYTHLTNSYVDLAVRSHHTDVQTLLSLLPEETSRKLGNYQSQGELFFNGTVKGKVNGGASPHVQIHFGCKDATLIHPSSGKRIESVSLTGKYDNGRLQNLTTSKLSLKNIQGNLAGRAFSGNFSVLNFENPSLVFDLTGAADVASLLAFYPVEKIERASGEIALQVSFDGKMSDLKAERLIQYVRTSGEITVKDLQFKLRGTRLLFDAFNGNFHFRRSDLQVNNFSGRAGSSDFTLNGYFKNIMAYLLLKEQDLAVEANFQSGVLNLDELLTAQAGTAPASTQVASQPYRFRLSPRLSLDLNCRVDRLNFRRFRARHVRGQLDLQDQWTRITDLALQTAGGSIALDATVNGQQANRIVVGTQASLKGIAVDSAFYIFENFKQTFIQDRNLKGQLSSEVQANLVFDEQLNLLSPLAKADIQVSIVNGELNHFAPMQKLSFFLRRRELANIRFSELQNNIRIENRVVSIPEMEIRSSVSNISVFGTHTFDQEMEYHLRFPISNFARPDKDEKFGPVASVDRGSGNLLLVLRGTSNNFRVGYDLNQVGKKIKEDLQKGGIKNIFKKQEKPSEKKSGSDEEYFDFD